MAVDVAIASRRLIDTVSSRRVYRDIYEIALVAIAFLLYFIVRASVVQRDEEALRNARDIIDLQKTLGFFWEPDLNAAVLDYGALSELAPVFKAIEAVTA